MTVDYAPLRSGKNGGALLKITLADGRELKTPRSEGLIRAVDAAPPTVNVTPRN